MNHEFLRVLAAEGLFYAEHRGIAKTDPNFEHYIRKIEMVKEWCGKVIVTFVCSDIAGQYTDCNLSFDLEELHELDPRVVAGAKITSFYTGPTEERTR
jgi:hypothetical protein